MGLLTGITMAVRGCINKSNGIFVATDHCLCGLPPLSPLQSIKQNGDKFIAFVSGLEIAKMQSSYAQSLQMLFDYLSGNATASSSKICRVVFAGNIICEELPDEDLNTFYDKKFKKNEQIKIALLDSALKELDVLMSQLATSCDVVLMPGTQVPSDLLMPQQPFHRCLFPLSSSFNTFKRVSNPYSVGVDGLTFLGTAGQNFRDMMMHSKLSMIECMELSLRSRIIAPTAPDTLSCFPFRNNDPFLISTCPNIYFSGNNDEFKYKMINDGKVCLLQVPSFVKTQQIVLFNLRTMEPKVMQFGVA